MHILMTWQTVFRKYSFIACTKQNKIILKKKCIFEVYNSFKVHLRRSAREHADPENDLYQWYRGSKFCSGPLEGIVTLDPTGTGYEIKVRGPGSMKAEW